MLYSWLSICGRKDRGGLIAPAIIVIIDEMQRDSKGNEIVVCQIKKINIGIRMIDFYIYLLFYWKHFGLHPELAWDFDSQIAFGGFRRGDTQFYVVVFPEVAQFAGQLITNYH